MWTRVKYYLVPPVFLVFFTCIVHYLTVRGKGEDFTFLQVYKLFLGNSVSWFWCSVIFPWAFVSLKIPSKLALGPETSYEYKPTYKDNGWEYYCFTLFVYVLVDPLFPGVSASVYDNYPQIIGSFSTIALLLCSFLLIKGKLFPSHSRDLTDSHPLLYEFYRGMELHPVVLGVDVKQLTNCRIGLMGWQIYISAFFLTSLRRSGLNIGFLVNFLLQTIYIAKFFWWEVGYFYTLDMMLDRAGYYICWGCLVWVPCLYTYSSYYMVHHPSSLSSYAAYFIFILGIFFIFLNYRVDREKQLFRSSPNYKCKIWGRQASFIMAHYKDHNGKSKNSGLLTSGFWGVARHLNYTFELLVAFLWCTAAGFNNFPWTYLYFIFLFVLLIHRTIRDDEKCRSKYGRFWEMYCTQVPYRLVPHVW